MIKANFSAYATYVTDSLNQWDIDQTLTVTGLNLTNAPEVHFSNANVDRAIVRQATMTNHVVSVAIPNSLLQDPLRIYAHIGIYEGNTFKVVEAVEIPVNPRKRPLDYQIEADDEEVYSFKRLENMLENAATKDQVANIVANVGSTAELVDVRYGADGVTYASAGEAVRGQLLTTADVYNVTHKKPLEGQYYTLATAVGAVPTSARRAGMIITFRPTYESWETYQYTVKDVSDANWNNLSYWKNITYASELHNLYRGAIKELGYTSFDECKAYGYYRFFTADIVNITDAPSNLAKAGNLYVYPFFGGTTAQFIRDLDGNEWFKYPGIEWICTNYKNEARLTALENSVAEMKSNSIKWCALGDSITQGYYSYIDADGDVSYALDNEKGWAKRVATITGYTLFNKAVGGSGYLSTRTAESPVDNAKAVADATDFSQFDLVTLAFGVNDWKYNCVLGSMADPVASGSSVYSNMRYVIEKIITDNPFCKIVVITPMNSGAYGDEANNWGLGHAFSNNGTLEDIFNAQKEVCEYYGIEYIDMTHASIVNRKNIASALPDGVHPAEDTHKALARELAKKIEF